MEFAGGAQNPGANAPGSPDAPDLRLQTGVVRLVPVGGDIEYTDEVTLGRSLAGRRDL